MERAAPVTMLVTTTEAPGTAAPELSGTVPAMLPSAAVWATGKRSQQRGDAATKARAKSRAYGERKFHMGLAPDG